MTDPTHRIAPQRLAVFGVLLAFAARLVVMERRAHKDAIDWQRIAENYRWKLDDHGKGWCKR